MSYLVTGASGFLGRAVVRHLEACGRTVVAVKREPPMGETAFDELLIRCQPEVVVHTAGSASVPASFVDPWADFQSGPQLTFRLLEALRRHSPASRLVFFSSAAVYGEPVCLPVLESEECRPLSPYGFHKVACELLCRQYRSLYGMQVSILRIFSAYGPGLRKQVFWDLSRQLARNPREIVLQGTGMESRDFVFADDVARAVMAVAEHGDFNAAAYNVAGGREVFLRDLVRSLIDAFGVSPEICFNGKVPTGNPLRWQASIDSLRATGFQPRVDFSSGVASYVEWFRNQT